MAAPPLLSVCRYAALFAGASYGSVRNTYLKGKDAKYQADIAAKKAAEPKHGAHAAH